MEEDSSNTPNSPLYQLLYDQATGNSSRGGEQPAILVTPPPNDNQQNTPNTYQLFHTREIPSPSTSGSASPRFSPQNSGHYTLFPFSSADYQQNTPNTNQLSPTLDISDSSTSLSLSPEPFFQASGHQSFPSSTTDIHQVGALDNLGYSQENANSNFTSLLQASSSLSIGQQMLLSSSSTSSQQTPSSTESTSRSLETPGPNALKSASPRHSFRRSKQQMSSSTLNQQTPSPVRPAPYTSVPPRRASPDGRRQMLPPQSPNVVRRRVASGSIQRREGDENRNEDIETVRKCEHPKSTEVTYCDCCKRLLCQECSTKVTRHRSKIELYKTLEHLRNDVVSKSVSAGLKIHTDYTILENKRQKTKDHLKKVKRTSQSLTSYKEDLKLLKQLFKQAMDKKKSDYKQIKNVVQISRDEGNYSKLNSIRTQIINLHLQKAAVKKSFLDNRDTSRNLCDVLDVLENEEENEETDVQINRFVGLLQEHYPIFDYDPTNVAGPSTSSGISSNSLTSSLGAASLAYQAGSSFSTVSGASAFSRSAAEGLNRDWVTAEGKWIVNSDNSYQGALEALKSEERPKQILVVVPPGGEHSENLLRNLLNSLKTVRCELKLRCLDSFYQGRDTDVDKDRLTVLFGPGWTKIIDGPCLTEFVGYLEAEDVLNLPCTLQTIGQHFKTAEVARLFYELTTTLINTYGLIKIHASLPLEGLKDPVRIQTNRVLGFLKYYFVVHVPYVTGDHAATVVKNYEMKGHFLSWDGTLFLPECRLTEAGAAQLAEAFKNVERIYTNKPAKIYFTSDPSYTHHQHGVKAALESIVTNTEVDKVDIVEEGMCAVWDLPAYMVPTYT